MKKVRNLLNYDCHSIVGEINDEPSMAVPNQSLTVREILARHTRGLPVTGNINSYYDENEDDIYMPDIKTLDLSEIDDYKAKYADILKRRKKDIDDKAKADKAAEIEKYAAMERELEELRSKSTNPS